jgi:hypothetical protein
MTIEREVVESSKVDQVELTKQIKNSKRNIVLFTSENPIAVNLDHVSIIRREGKTLYFDFHAKTQPVDLVDEDAAKSLLQTLLNIWSGDVLE